MKFVETMLQLLALVYVLTYACLCITYLITVKEFRLANMLYCYCAITYTYLMAVVNFRTLIFSEFIKQLSFLPVPVLYTL